VATGEFTLAEVSTPTGTAEVVADITTGQTITPPIATVTVTRQNKKFTMTGGVWVFSGDF